MTMMIWMALFRCVGAFLAAANTNSYPYAAACIRSRRDQLFFFHPPFVSRNQNAINNKPPSSLFATVTNTRGGGGNNDTNTLSAESNNNGNKQINRLDSLLEKAQHYLREKDADQAFATLAEAYGIDPTSTKIASLFESCLRLKVDLAEDAFYKWKNAPDANAAGNTALSEAELTNLFQDRMGLSSLFIDKEEYDEAGIQLRKAIEEANYWLNFYTTSSSTTATTKTTRTQLDLSNTQFAHWQPSIDRAQYLLYRTNAACCHWDTYFEDGHQLSQSLLSHNPSPSSGHVQRILHPFDALKFPCISLELASKIAQSYAARALESHGLLIDTEEIINCNQQRRPTVAVNRKELPKNNQEQKIRIGYISPDFTSRHPLAFLMQHVFQYHDRSQFSVYIYSLSSKVDDNGPEVSAIQESCDQFTYLSPSLMSPIELYRRMVQDELDIIVDLCGYAGTSIVAEIMASRCRLLEQNDKHHNSVGNNNEAADGNTRRLPVHVSYMGFPGSVGSSRIWDYSIFDQVVIPPEDKYGIREHYNEALVYMPHCYFVNSHKTVLGKKGDGILLANEEERIQLRSKYGIHPTAFVYCCHSRPDKIDPSTFRTWMRALSTVRSEYFAKHSNESDSSDSSGINGAPILWLLRSGKEMEENLRQLVRTEFGERMEDALLFADVSERNEHLRRLGCADVFLDTPAYNAHTLGCDALYLGLPIISLLRDDGGDSSTNASDNQENNSMSVQSTIDTNKLASRVGASLLRAAMLDDLVYSNMHDYEDAMVKCATNKEWFESIREKLRLSIPTSPLFDTERWVRNLEASFMQIKAMSCEQVNTFPDIIVTDP